MALTVAQMVARLTADTSGFYRGMAIANSSMIRSGGIISRVAAGAGLATLGMGIMSLRAAGNFEESMNVLQAVSGATTGQFKSLRVEAIALGADMKLPNVSAKDAAQAMQELAKGGLSVKDILSATRGTLQLGLAANIGYAESAVIVARAMKAFNLEGSQATKVADLFTAAANKSTADMTDVALGFQMASAQFAAGDQTIQGLTTSLALMANAGIVGSDAGTSLKTMMNRLMAPTKKAKELMKDLGIKVYDASGNMKPMPALIDTFNKSLSGMSKEQRNAALYTIFGSDAIRASRVMLNAGSEGWLKMQASITKGGEAQRFAEARTKGFNGALQALGSAIETQAIILGTAMLPAMTKLARAMARFVNNVDPQKIIEFFGAIASGVKWVYDLATGTGLASSAFQTLAAGVIAYTAATRIAATATAIMAAITGTGLITGLMTAVRVMFMARSATAAWAAMQLILNAALIANPIGVIIMAIALLVTALYLAYTRSETFRNIVQAAFAAVGKAFQILIQVASWVRDHWKIILMAMFGPVGLLVAAVIKYWNQIKNVTESIWNAISGFFRRWWPLLLTIFFLPLAAIFAVVNRTWQTVLNTTISVFNAIKGAVQAAWGAIRGVISTVVNAIISIVRAGFNAVKSAILNPLRSVGGAIAGPLGAIVSAVLGFIGRMLSAGAQLGRAIVNGIVSGIRGGAGAIAGAAKGVAEGALNAAKSFLGVDSPSKVFANQVGKPIAQGIIMGFLLGSGDLPTKMKERLRTALEAAKKTIDIYMDKFKAAFARMSGDALSAFDAITGAHMGPASMEIYLEEARRAAAQNQQALVDAQAELQEAMQGGDPGDILRAQQAVADAEWAIRKVALESQAELEKKEYDASRALQRRALEDRLADLQEQLMKHPLEWEKINEEITTLLNNYGIDYQSAGAILGTSFAHGLRDARAEIVKEITAIAKIIRRYLRLKSPAERGPLHDLNKWWRPFAPTLLSGLDTDAIRRGALGAVAGVGPTIGGLGSRGGLSPAVRGAQAGTSVHVYNPVLLGQNREAGRMLAEVVEQHLNQSVRVGAS